jgi:hypothetical protein
MTMKNEVPSKGLEWANLVLGAGLACAAVPFAGLPLAAWNAGIVGLLIVFFAALALYRYGAWAEWSNLVLGCWAVIAPFVLGFGWVAVPMWTHVVVGICVAAISAIQLLNSSGGHAPLGTGSTSS